MEHKLAEFRARRRAEREAGETSQPESNSTSKLHDSGPTTEENSTSQSEKPQIPTTTVSANNHPSQDGNNWLMDSTLGRWLGVDRLAVTNLTILKLLLWLVLLGLFAELDFGLPFFLISLFYWIYEGLRGPAARQPGELSAYSVFNPDCQPILGTLTAEQLEGEMGYRPLANRQRT
ncbi:SAYSvFN domain-containing protein 1 [Chanos chanos]|uniref:SAYSvFN domain-containing protein 1 n=1 Tax=Chanos chanos TaxID=29144 RepID=A0A6J2V3B1_CHACN|nr:SAYSvFN domain-containing protein 1 [Chanos chanos]